MKGFDPHYTDLPDYIIKVTKEIWEERGTATLRRSYAPDIPVRTPMGITVGNEAVIAATMAVCHEFPDRQLFAEDVIFCGDEDAGFLSSHRLITTASQTGSGQFGLPSGKRWTVRVLADCSAKNNVIDDEWLVRDYGGIVRQLGHDVREFTAALIEAEDKRGGATLPYLPENDIEGPYKGTGNDHPVGARYAETLHRIMSGDFAHVLTDYDRAVIGAYAGAEETLGRDAACAFWIGLRASFPSAEFRVHHVIGMDGGALSPRAAVRWSLDGKHDGWGRFGPPTGARVHVMGIAHAEYGPWGLRREYALFDDVAIWKQILLAATDRTVA